MTFSRDFVVFLFLDTFKYGKCLETGETTKSLEYGKCLETGEMTKSLQYGMCLETGKRPNPLKIMTFVTQTPTHTPSIYIPIIIMFIMTLQETDDHTPVYGLNSILPKVSVSPQSSPSHIITSIIISRISSSSSKLKIDFHQRKLY